MRIAGGPARTVGHQRPRGPRRNLALVFDIAVEQRVHDRGALGIGQQLAAQADEPAGRNLELQADAAGAVIDHLGHLALASSEFLDHHPDEVLRAIDHQQFERLVQLAADLLVMISGLPTISSYPSRRIISIRIASCSSPRPITLNASGPPASSTLDRDVGQQFFVEPVAQVAAM